MKPGYLLFETDFGWMGIWGSPAGLRGATLPQPSPEAVLQAMGGGFEGAPAGASFFGDLPHRLRSYLSGETVTFPHQLDLADATPFQRAVWEVARRIPYGETRSYAWCAHQIGKPGAARAVGTALGRNPVPIVIPCHRVVTSSGGLGGYAGGLAMKRRLLEMEGLKPGR